MFSSGHALLGYAVALDLEFFCWGVRSHDATIGLCLQALPCTATIARSVPGLVPNLHSEVSLSGRVGASGTTVAEVPGP
jgi:hypothetical protein